MKKERIIEEMARIDGFTLTEDIEHNTYPYGWTVRVKTWFDRLNNKVHCSDLPDYLNDHNAVQLVIDGMDIKTLKKYDHEVWVIVTGHLSATQATYANRLKATCLPKCEAILKAYGKYDEECE